MRRLKVDRKVSVISTWSNNMFQYESLRLKERNLPLSAVKKAAEMGGLCAHLRTAEELYELELLVGVQVPTAEEEGRSRTLKFHDGDVVIHFHKKKGRYTFTLLQIEAEQRPRSWFQELLAS